MTTKKKRKKPVTRRRPTSVVGWREWVSLPELGVGAVKAKIDTGARSSSLHAYDMKRFKRRGVSMIRFKIHPMQRDNRTVVEAEARVVELRKVRSSSGTETLRPVVATPLRLGEDEWEIELTLVRRDAMGFRMLLGRQAVRGHFLVDPGRSFLASSPPPKPGTGTASPGPKPKPGAKSSPDPKTKPGAKPSQTRKPKTGAKSPLPPTRRGPSPSPPKPRPGESS